MTAARLAAETALRHTWRNDFRDLTEEHGFVPLRIEGRLPEDLTGTLYRNGPSRFSSFGTVFRHWFDGDGAVSAVRMGGGKAEGAVRMVESKGYLHEKKAGRALYGGYGTVAPGPFFKRAFPAIKNTANTSVVIWQGRVLALQEGSAPTELSPADLSTLGETRLGDVVVHAFSAHPHRIPARKATYNHGLRMKGRPTLQIYELPDRGPARMLTELPLSGATMVHDFIATERHLVYFVSPLRLNLLPLLAGIRSFSDSLEWRPRNGTEVIVVPIDAPELVRRFTVEPFYQWHFGNAFEEDGALVVDYVRLPDWKNNAWLGALPHGVPDFGWEGRYHRARLELSTGRFESTPLWDGSCEFPRVGSTALGRRYRYAYVAAHSGPEAAHGLFDRVARLDLETGTAETVELGPEQYPSEPIFVRRPDASAENDGWLLTHVYDGLADTTHVAVLDAARIDEGPIARLHFGHRLPFTFHGNFARE